jgi:hypothetical protein
MVEHLDRPTAVSSGMSGIEKNQVLRIYAVSHGHSPVVSFLASPQSVVAD